MLTGQHSRLLEAIFPLVPDTKHIDFLFVYQITSEIVPDHQIPNGLRIRRPFDLRTQQRENL